MKIFEKICRIIPTDLAKKMAYFSEFFHLISQSLSLPHMGNGVHFFLLTDIACLIDYEFQGIG